jgi:hypothetical protein
MAHNVHINGSDTSTGRLQLSDSGYTLAEHGTKVNWHIHADDVESIEIVQKPGRSDNVWASPPQKQGNHWTATTIPRVTRFMEYSYDIKWKSRSLGTQHTHDPIIAMRPSGIDGRVARAFVAGMVVGGAIVAMLLLDRKKIADISNAGIGKIRRNL